MPLSANEITFVTVTAFQAKGLHTILGAISDATGRKCDGTDKI